MRYNKPMRWSEWFDGFIDNVDEDGFRKLKKDTPKDIVEEYKEYKTKIKQYRQDGILS